ncbi:adenylate/guanylate cyclase domain-containing protein [Bradyrhizobium sp. JR3.5]
MAADVAGYSRLMSHDETATLQTLSAYRQIFDGLISEYGGRIANTAGDSILAEFPSANDAVECSVAVQVRLVEAEDGQPEDLALRFRIGIHLGDVVVQGNDLLGDGVNIAARLEGISDPGGICISGAVFDQVDGKINYPIEPLGLQALKNITRPIEAYAIRLRSRLASSGASKANNPASSKFQQQNPILPICRRRSAGLFCRRQWSLFVEVSELDQPLGARLGATSLSPSVRRFDETAQTHSVRCAWQRTV